MAAREGGIGKKGRNIVILGILLLISGFFLLSFADPAGRNTASSVASAIVILSYVVIGIGIIHEDVPAAKSDVPKPDISKK